MPERHGRFVVYTVDDEMPYCMRCDNCDSKYDCSKFCGAKHGWYGYRRTESNNNDR